MLLTLVLLVVLLPAATAVAFEPAAVRHDLQARYDVDLHLDWDTRKVQVKTGIDVHNTSGAAVGRLHLNTVAAKHGQMRDLRVRVDGSAAAATVSGQTIIVPLRPALAAGASVKLWVGYKARLATTASGRAYFFAKLGGVAQLYRFIPWLSRRIAFSGQDHGEPFLTSVSPRVEVTVSADRKLSWATSGKRIQRHSDRKFTFLARSVRDFNIAASPSWKVVRGVSKRGTTTILAHVRRADGRRLVRLARDELARFERLTGVPYPHPTYRIAETGGGLAMESPGLIWIPSSRPAADHPYLVSHETAHQWWYSAVGNDQSTDAFADEALADYFARKAHLSIRSSRCKRDRLDRDIRGYSTRCYFEVVYVQGARFLHNLRKDFGDKRFKAAIRDYTKVHRYGIGSNVRLLEAFRGRMGDRVLKRYHARFPSLY
jgi:hypothetical protein